MMTSYRLRNILIAVGLAVAAALLTVFYVSNYKSSVRSNSETVSVLVASQDIPQGLWVLGRQQEHAHDAGSRAGDRRGDLEADGHPEPHRDAADLHRRAGDSRRFGPWQGQRPHSSRARTAIQFDGEPNQILAGILRPGDHVDIVANVKFPAEDSQKHFTKVVPSRRHCSRTSDQWTRPHRSSTRAVPTG
jgi:hypothetical protein